MGAKNKVDSLKKKKRLKHMYTYFCVLCAILATHILNIYTFQNQEDINSFP